MLPDSPVITLLFLLGHAIVGMAIGALSGWLTLAVTKTAPKRILIDALIGLISYLVGLMTCFLPWHQNTISYRLSGGTVVTSTAYYFQYYARVAVIAAIMLPFLYELNRFLRAPRSTSR
jgi:hypothetical protein